MQEALPRDRAGLFHALSFGPKARAAPGSGLYTFWQRGMKGGFLAFSAKASPLCHRSEGRGCKPQAQE